MEYFIAIFPTAAMLGLYWLLWRRVTWLITDVDNRQDEAEKQNGLRDDARAALYDYVVAVDELVSLELKRMRLLFNWFELRSDPNCPRNICMLHGMLGVRLKQPDCVHYDDVEPVFIYMHERFAWWVS